MKTGIIIYSRTNNTVTVGERLAEALRIKGHDVTLRRITAANDDPQSRGPVVLLEKPDISAYDYIIFGAPVQAFSLSPVMKAYMAQLAPLGGKKVACFVTQQFKRPWMGGNQAIGHLTRSTEGLGGAVSQTGIVHWSSTAREEQIGRLISALTENASAGAVDGSGNAR
jgi:flavodoxin